MKCRQLHFSVITMLFLFLTSSCQKESVSENTHTLKIQVAQSPDILNPVISRTNVSRQIEDLMFLPDRKSTRLNSSHVAISYAVFCLKKKNFILVEPRHLQIYLITY